MNASRVLRMLLAATAAAIVAFGLTASAASAGVVVISRDSTVTVEGVGQDTPFSDEQTFSGSGAFANQVVGEEGSPPDGPYARGSAAQTTTVAFDTSGGPFTGSGRLTADAFAQHADQPQSVNQVSADSILEAVFRVLDSNEPFSITGTFDDLQLFPGASVRLINTAASPSTPAVFAIENDSEVFTEFTFDSGELSLSPAEYRLTLSAGAGSSGTGPGGVEPFGNSAGIDFNLSVGEAVTPPVIPLPAGVWAGMVGLAAAAGAVRKVRVR